MPALEPYSPYTVDAATLACRAIDATVAPSIPRFSKRDRAAAKIRRRVASADLDRPSESYRRVDLEVLVIVYYNECGRPLAQLPRKEQSMSFQAYLDNIHAKTGKHPEDFHLLAKKAGLTGSGVTATRLTAWLKQEFGLGHGHAMAIFAVFKSKAWIVPPAARSTKSSQSSKASKASRASKTSKGSGR